MEEKVYYQDKNGLIAAGEKIISLTFLSAYTDKKGLLYLVYELGLRLAKLYPKVKLYLLKYQEQEGGGPGYEMKISLVPLRKLKELCMSLEVDKNERRIADIDVFIHYAGKLCKISRRMFPIK